MENLAPPVNRYLTGKLPSHSSSVKLAENYKNLDSNALKFILFKNGYMTEEGKPTKKAATDGLIDRCEKSILWNLEKVSEKLYEVNFAQERQYVNQELTKIESTDPVWVNLGTLGTYFNATANQIGKWLDQLELRDSTGMATKEALDFGLATEMEMNADSKGKKTRKINQWDLVLMQQRLVEAGHPLDFDYEATLKGKGRNSDVSVDSLDNRVKEFAKEFLKTFKNVETRHETPSIVKKQPKLIQKKAELLFNKPGFISEGIYLKHLKR